MPLRPGPLAGLGRVDAGEGRIASAKASFAKLDQVSAGPAETAEVVISNALWTHDYANAERLLADVPVDGHPAWRAAVAAGFRALASGDPAAKARAAAELGRQRPPGADNGAFELRLMAALGDTAGALASPALLAAAHPFHRREAVGWDSVFADVRRQPGFVALAAELGLIDYWRALKVRPDYCARAAAPPLCAAI